MRRHSRAAAAALGLWLAASPAAALRAAPSAARRAEACTEYTLPPEALLSGSGKLWEYYHFLIDFAPAVYYHIRNDSAPCKILTVPGWHSDDKFSLAWSAHPQWSMQDKFDYFFAPLGLSLEPAPSREEMAAALPRRTLVDVSGHTSRGWSNQTSAYFLAFRAYAQAMPGVRPARRDVLAVRRGHVRGYRGFKVAFDRRHLEEDFYARLQEDMASKGWSTAVVSLEAASAAEQIAMFSGARAVVAQHGAALSNVIFAGAGTPVVEIGHRDHLCYETLARKLGLPYLHFEATEYPKGLASSVQALLGRA